MQVYRKEWINEGKPRASVENVSDDDEDFVDRTITGGGQHSRTNGVIEFDVEHGSNDGPEQQPQPGTDDGDNDLYAEPPAKRPIIEQPNRNDDAPDQPEDDELDALLAEDAARDTHPPGITQQQPSTRDTFADEEEAMAGMDFDW